MACRRGRQADGEDGLHCASDGLGMAIVYPSVEPYQTGMLDVGEGNEIYWETCGNPDGKPALVLHGGPGSGCTTGLRRLFDPRRLPHRPRRPARCRPEHATCGGCSTDLSANTTVHLIGDLERLREHLEIDRWLVYGRSWGTTLGLAYAECHRERVSEMILAAVC